LYVLSAAQGMTAKEIAKAFGISPGSVVNRLSSAMYKLGVHRTTALVAEAMKRQIISPVCVVLAAVIAIHALIDDQPMRRDRRMTERRLSELRVPRRADAAELVG
jgi:AcrR family transcriptional regulator